MKVYLNIIEPDGRARRFPVETKPVKVGRSSGAQVCISDDLCSSLHAMLYIKDGHLYVEDLESKNGTILNGIKVFRQRVFVGDQILLGSTRVGIDPEKNDKETLKILTSTAKRLNGEITLELESHAALTGKNSKKAKDANLTAVRSSRLYDGADDVKRENTSQEKSNAYHFAKTFMAGFVDFIFTLIIFGGTFSAMKESQPDMQNKHYAIASGIAALVFYFWNCKRKSSSSIGEKLLGLTRPSR